MNGQILPLIAKDESTKVSKQGWPSMVMPCLDQSCRMINGRALHTMCPSDKNNNSSWIDTHTHKKKVRYHAITRYIRYISVLHITHHYSFVLCVCHPHAPKIAMDALMGLFPKPPAVLGTSGTIRTLGGQSLTATASDELLGFLGFGIFWVLILIRYHLAI